MAASVESQPGTPTAAVPMGKVAKGSGKKPKTPIKPVTKSKGKKRATRKVKTFYSMLLVFEVLYCIFIYLSYF